MRRSATTAREGGSGRCYIGLTGAWEGGGGLEHLFALGQVVRDCCDERRKLVEWARGRCGAESDEVKCRYEGGRERKYIVELYICMSGRVTGEVYVLQDMFRIWRSRI